MGRYALKTPLPLVFGNGVYSGLHYVVDALDYLDRDKKEKLSAEEDDPKVKTGDVLKIAGERFETTGMARRWRRAGCISRTASAAPAPSSWSAPLSSSPGVVVQMADFGQYSGRYLVERSTHTTTRGGYTPSAQLLEARG